MSALPVAETRSRNDPDLGASTAAMLGVVLVALALLLTVCALGHVALMNHRAAKAADLAALAAADTARGLRPGSACDVARELVAQNGARMESCALAPGRSDVVDVRTAVDLMPALSALGPAEGVARAGPPPEDEVLSGEGQPS